MTHAAIRELVATCHAAMEAGDTGRLAVLLDAGYSLVHITGYVQPREEWFAVIDRRTFDYHRIAVDLAGLDIRIDGAGAAVTGSGIFDATINGMHAPWPLRFRLTCVRRGDGWKIAAARYERA